MSDSDDNKTSCGKGRVDAMTLSNAESRFFCNIVMNLSSKADIDWEKVAESTGFKNAGVAKTRFGQIKRKLGLTGQGGKPVGMSQMDTPPKTPRKKTAGEDNGVTKSGGKRSAKAKPKVKSESHEEEAKHAVKKEGSAGHEIALRLAADSSRAAFGGHDLSLDQGMPFGSIGTPVFPNEF